MPVLKAFWSSLVKQPSRTEARSSAAREKTLGTAVRVRKPLRMKGAGQLRRRRLRRGRAASIGSSRLSPAPTATQVRGESTIVTARPVSSRSR
jgi:hypothetical protein